MAQHVRVRFAPSPTGPLHIGGVRTALYNYLFARHYGGQFLLRVEDTDQTRYVATAEDYIHQALQWLGIEPDEGPQQGGPDAPYRQSERKEQYRQYAERLVEHGHAYYAFDTAEELAAMREQAEKSGMKAFGYNYLTRQHAKNSLSLPQDEVQRKLAAGDPYVIRIKMPRKEEIRFQDIVRGWVTVATNTLDDKVLLKQDGMPTYHLANVVDDHLMNITHVIRGEEWLPSTPLHVFMYDCLGWEMPQFAHLPLLMKPNGKGKLSKRDGKEIGVPVFPIEWQDPDNSEAFMGYREEGYLPAALLNFLALMGWHPSGDEELFTLEELIQAFSLERVGKSGVKYNVDKLRFFNQHYIRQTPNHAFRPLLEEYVVALGVPVPSAERLDELVELLKERVDTINDFRPHAHAFLVAPQEFDPALVKKRWKPQLVPVLQDIQQRWAQLPGFGPEAAKQAVNEAAEEAGVKMGKLMPMFRLALMGEMQGPGIFEIVAWLGQDETLRRLSFALEQLPAESA